MAEDRDLAAFIRTHLRSVWALELLLALRRSRDRSWSGEELVRELRASTGLISENLAAFERGGLALRDEHGGYRYAPTSPAVEALCEALEAAFRERPVAIINLIVRPGPEAVWSFADAFKFRGDSK